MGGTKRADRMLSGERVSPRFRLLSDEGRFIFPGGCEAPASCFLDILICSFVVVVMVMSLRRPGMRAILRKKTFWSRVSVFSVQKFFKGFTTMEVINRSFVESELKKSSTLKTEKRKWFEDVDEHLLL